MTIEKRAGYYYDPYDEGSRQNPELRWRRDWSIAQEADLPLGLPLLLFALVTFLLWRLDRRPPPTHCQSCGYELTGNVSGICPECGTARRAVS